ncbi:MAG: hypothetical protein ACT4O0_05040 [Pseudonocardia sp.]|jgi:uncharacterized protein YjbJ (UPF0337 family)
MGALKDEAAGTAKKVAGKVAGDDDLEHRGEEQIEEGVEKDEQAQARRLGTVTGGTSGDTFDPFKEGREAIQAEERGEESPALQSHAEQTHTE